MNASEPTQGGMRPTFKLLMGGLIAFLVVMIYFKTRTPHVTSEPVAETPAEETGGDTNPAVARRVPTPAEAAVRVIPRTTPPKPKGPVTTLEAQWGIEISSMRLTMGNSAVDLRYKVIDPAKAALLGDGKTPAYIIERSTGKKLVMPTPPKEGAFPPTMQKLQAGKTYFSMVSNQGGILKSGSHVTVMVGNSEVTNLTLE
jgi:hypothetical protein